MRLFPFLSLFVLGGIPLHGEDVNGPVTHPTKVGTYRSEDWSYTYTVGQQGTRSESRTGILVYRDKELVGEPGNILTTPLGRFVYFIDPHKIGGPGCFGWIMTMTYNKPIWDKDGKLNPDFAQNQTGLVKELKEMKPENISTRPVNEKIVLKGYSPEPAPAAPTPWDFRRRHDLKSTPRVKVDETKFINEYPMGRLGYMVGTYVEIEGVQQLGTLLGNRTLRVDTIDGEKIEKSILLTIDNIGREGLPPGKRCVLRGYETVRMVGLPEAVVTAEKLDQPSFYFQMHRYFIIRTVVAPAELNIVSSAVD
jgi:hypothetical protein